MEKTIHQKVGHLYRTLKTAFRKERGKCKYFKRYKPTSNRDKEKQIKAQARVAVLVGIIITLENDFGMKTNGKSYLDIINKNV